MRAADREPGREELLAMAYADGELSGAELAEFEALLVRRADLRLEVARARRLAVMARVAAGPEPMDDEWRALGSEPGRRFALGAGWISLGAGVVLVEVGGLWELWSRELPAWLKLGVTAAALGLGILLASAVRARLRTRGLDPYRDLVR